MSGRCLDGVWKLSGKYLIGILKVIGRCLEGVLKMSDRVGRCRKMPTRCLEHKKINLPNKFSDKKYFFLIKICWAQQLMVLQFLCTQSFFD